MDDKPLLNGSSYSTLALLSPPAYSITHDGCGWKLRTKTTDKWFTPALIDAAAHRHNPGPAINTPLLRRPSFLNGQWRRRRCSQGGPGGDCTCRPRPRGDTETSACLLFLETVARCPAGYYTPSSRSVPSEVRNASYPMAFQMSRWLERLELVNLILFVMNLLSAGDWKSGHFARPLNSILFWLVCHNFSIHFIHTLHLPLHPDQRGGCQLTFGIWHSLKQWEMISLKLPLIQ